MNRNNLIMYSVGIIAVVIAALWFAQTGSKSGSNLSAYDNLQVPASLLSQLHIPSQEFAQVGIGASAGNLPKAIASNITLSLDNKTEILYIGADYCPYCAAERWPLVIALSRFGNFTKLYYMTSSAQDYAPSTPTFSFHNSTYTSDYISFVGVETQENKLVNGVYGVLQNPDPQQLAVLSKFNYQGGIPFIDFGNVSVIRGATYDPMLLQGKTWSEIAASLSDANSTISQSILGSANLITAAICNADGNQPAGVCSQNYIQQLEKNIH